jgi:general nucleoside transport system permease protein
VKTLERAGAPDGTEAPLAASDPVDDYAEEGRDWGAVGRSLAVNVALYVATVAVAMFLGGLLVLIATDASPWDVYDAMFQGSLNGGAAIGLTLDRATPTLIVAIGALVATRASITNLGPEGQLLVGACVGTIVALNVPGPGPVAIPIVIVCSALGGALWASLAAFMRYTRGVDIVISTLLLNFVAEQLVTWSVSREYLLQEGGAGNTQSFTQSERIPGDLHLPRLGTYPGFNVSTGLLVALALLAIVWVLLDRTRWGFRLKVLGQNPMTARRVGISVAVFGGGALIVSGALAGAAGGVMLTGTVFRFQPAFSQGVGFEGLLCALIARRRPGWLVPVALLFGALRAGGGYLSSTGVPGYFVDIVQALIVLATLFPPLFIDLVRRRREHLRARAAAQLDHDGAVAVEVAS